MEIEVLNEGSLNRVYEVSKLHDVGRLIHIEMS
jgi:hypothetical protein